MRDPKRIPMIISKLEQLWQLYPDLRFFQLVEALRRSTGLPDAFYVEDDVTEGVLNGLIKEYKKNKEG